MIPNKWNSVMDETIDNLHTIVDLVYLAAIIDGEGTITLERTGKRRLAGVMGLSPKVIVANTNEAIIQHVVNILRRIGVNPHIKSQEAGKYNRGKKMFWITVQGLSKAARVLEKIKPYLVGKLAQTQLVLEFVAIRGESQVAKGKPYGEAELQILNRIRALNHRGVSTTEEHGLTAKAA